MHYWTLTNYADFTFQAPYNKRAWTPGWITHNTIVFPRVGSAAAPDADTLTLSDFSHLTTLFLATADRLADLALQIARIERQAKSGKISPRHAASRLRRILATVESSMETLDRTPL
jgi:hypothetical protein